MSIVSTSILITSRYYVFQGGNYLPQEGLDALKQLYGIAIAPFGRQLPEVVRCNQNCVEDLIKCSVKVFTIRPLAQVVGPNDERQNRDKMIVVQMDPAGPTVTEFISDVQLIAE